MPPRHHPFLLFLLAFWIFSCGAPLARGQDNAAKELTYPDEDFAKLDTFEAVAVEDADKLFLKKDFKGAYAAYKAYSFEFAKGEALPYVLLRMGRCLHLLGKRNTAIKAYQDVVDYFPDDIPFAAAALFYIGECHAQNGNESKSLATWARLVKDRSYVSQPRSGSALASLAAAMESRGNFAEATDYRWRTAVAFRESNARAAEAARNSVVFHYAVRKPDQEKMLQFCNEVGGFGWRSPIAKPADSTAYWTHIFTTVLNARIDTREKKEAAMYWSGQIGDRFEENDSMRVTWFSLILLHEQDTQKWAQRMENQFNLQPVTIERVKKWLGYYNRHPEIRSTFFASHGEPLLPGLKTEQRVSLMKHLRHPCGMHEQALAVLRTVRTGNMNDSELRDFAGFAAQYEGEDAFLRIAARIKDPTVASRTRFDFYYARSPRNGEMQKKALTELPTLKKSPDHAQDVIWPHATLMQWQGEYEQAIRLFQSANRGVDSTWAVINCHVALKQIDKAIQLTRELESLGGNVAATACLKAADIYRSGGDKKKEVQQLQLVLRRYPKSSQSSQAHDRLEGYGVKIIGGESRTID